MTVRIYTGGVPLQVIDEAPAPVNPVIVGFTATPSVITVGQTVILSGTIANATSLTLNGTAISSLPQPVTPTTTTTYVLVATGTAGTTPATASLSVTVNAVIAGVSTAAMAMHMAVRPKSIIMVARLPDLSGHTIQIGFNNIGDRYDRGQKPVELAGQSLTNPQGVGPTATIRGIIEQTVAPQLTFGAAWTATVTLAPFDITKPMLIGTPIVVGTVAVLATATFFELTFTKTAIPEGWYLASVTGQPTGWSVSEYPMYVRQGTVALPQTHTPVMTGSYMHHNTSRLCYALVPAKFEPIMVPLASRTYPPITPFLKFVPGPMNEMAKLVYTMLVPFKRDDVYRPSMLPSGVWTSTTMQRYFSSSFRLAEPPWTLLDGPRGRGVLNCATSLRESARPTGGKVLFTDPWRVGTVSDDGTVHTEAGYLHDEPLPYPHWDFFQQQRPPTPRRLVGDWSAVPVARRGFQELWDVAVDYRTTTLDNTVPPIGTPPEQPHIGSVVKYVTETAASTPSRCRVCKIVFDGQDRTKPAVVTEFVNMPNALPWGCDTYNNLLIVTLSGTNFVNAYDMDANGALVWSVPFTRPEGIRILDGFAYIGSFTSKAVHKMDLTTRVVTKFCDVPMDGNSGFVNVAVANNTFVPGVNVATVTWSTGQFGWPKVYGPDGIGLPVGDREFGWGEPKGTYLPDGLSYGSAVSMNSTRMTFATVQEGLHRVSAALPTDAVVPTIVAAGVKKWDDLDLRLIWSDYGFGYFGVPLPWGKYGPEVDAMLTNMGHTP